MPEYYDICEWCGLKYPRGGFIYWYLKVFPVYNDKPVEHKICDDCKKHLKKL